MEVCRGGGGGGYLDIDESDALFLDSDSGALKFKGLVGSRGNDAVIWWVVVS